MISKSIQLKAILMATLAFNFLFWKEKMGFNILLFDLLIGVSIYFLQPSIWKEKAVLITGVGTLLLALLVVWNNSLFSKVVHLLSCFSFLGFVQVRQMEFIGTAFGVGVANFTMSPLKTGNAIRYFITQASKSNSSLGPTWRWVQLSIVPVILVGAFYSLYVLANPAFAKLSGNFWGNVTPWIIPTFDVERILFFFCGVVLSCTLLWQSDFFKDFKEKVKAKNLTRTRVKNKIRGFNPMGLKMEYRSALILMAALNALLFLVNATDLWYVWLGNSKMEINLLSSYVHEGTWLLIMAVILGMAVLGYYFRRNINFLTGNTLLKTAAYCWIIQNGILALSVGMRNYRYIEHYGLAYKRLGVMLFLSLVIIGLVTMFVKVQQRKTFYYLLFKNAWACYFVLIMACSFNWDVLITQYNLSGYTRADLDTSYLVDDLSDKNLFVLLDYYSDDKYAKKWDSGFLYRLNYKKEKFLVDQDRYSWLSWNYADYRNKRFLEKQ